MKTAALSSRRAAAHAAAPRRARRIVAAVPVSADERAGASIEAASPTTPTTSSPVSRRALLASAAAAATATTGLFSPPPAAADIRQKNTFTVDLLPKFQLDVPSSWTTTDTEVPGAGASRPGRIWFPGDDPTAPGSVNVSLVATIIGADFTSLGSFGDADSFGESLVASMDRGFAGGPSARLVSARAATRQARGGGDGEGAAANDTTKPQKVYEIEYAVTRSEEEGERLFVSAVALSFDGVYNRLYTVTGQVAAGEAAEKHGKEVAEIVKSFVPPATRA